MANEQNLKPVRSKEEATERGRKGGIASGKARKEKADIRKAVLALLEGDITDKKTGNVISGAEAIAVAQMQKALKGDTEAFKVIRDTAGQKPVDKIEIAPIDDGVIAEIEKIMQED